MLKQNIRNLTLPEIETYFLKINQPKYRAKQLFEWLWQKHAHSFDAMTNVGKELRLQLSQDFDLLPLHTDATQYSADGTIKSRFKTHDGHLVEVY
jgi:23S rRNA (adenine2503-C2)-methyltransferase